MTWPLSGWIFSSSSSSSMEEDQNTQLSDEPGTPLNDDGDHADYLRQDPEIDEQNAAVSDDETDAADLRQSKTNSFSPIEDHIPTAIVIPANAPNNVVTVAIPAARIQERRPQRRTNIWTNEDEIELLRGFLEFSSDNRISGHRLQQQDAAAFYRKIKPKIQLCCDKNQLIDKLRRLKRKYQITSSKIDSGEKPSFRSLHDRSTFDISRKIWGRSSGKKQTPAEDSILDEVLADISPNYINIKVKREDPEDESEERDDLQQSTKRRRTAFLSGEASNSIEIPMRPSSTTDDIGKISGLVEEVARACLTPLFKELMSNRWPPIGLAGRIPSYGGGEAADERWRKQQAMEMEVYLKRLELVQEEIRASLKELRSKEEESKNKLQDDN
ncbi:probable transcription factor At3g04930 [Momordica charantia]|uniref:Probable transcription factor At3g04930 n=1 Tax=Momordica charantia TaxID=3673 RepID=A0A6J1CQ14_MOMCH|nr:probable transcription factor At3g04930 [Momordica charantia]